MKKAKFQVVGLMSVLIILVMLSGRNAYAADNIRETDVTQASSGNEISLSMEHSYISPKRIYWRASTKSDLKPVRKA